MAKPEMSEKFMIGEGIADARSDDRPQVGDDVVVRVAELARNAAPITLEEDRKRFGNALLIARYSMGIREVYPPEVEPFHRDDLWINTDDGESWDNLDGVDAYNLAELDKVVIGSGSSGATIVFDKSSASPDSWTATFEEGKRGPSQMYRRIYRALGSGALFDDGFKGKIWNANSGEFQEFIDTYEMN